MVGLRISSRIRIIVYSRMSRQFVRSTEPFGTPGELADVWLFSGVGSDVSRLMLEPVEGLVA